MKLSLMTFSMMNDLMRGMNGDIIAEIAKNNGISMVDMMEFEMKLYHLKKVKAALEKNKIQCDCLITSSPFYTAGDKVKEQLEHAATMAKDLGATCLMVIPGQTTAKEKKICKNLSKQEMLTIAVKHFKTAVEVGKKYDLQIGFENTPHAYKPLASSEDCKYVLDHVPGLGLIFDTGNFRVADTSCDELAIYEQLKSYIIRVHLKDVVVGPFSQGEECVDGNRIVAVATGSGIIPMEELLIRLRQDNYQGVLAIEYSAKKGVKGVGHSERVRDYVSYIKDVWDGTFHKPQYVTIPGLTKKTSRIFFGTAMKDMLMGKDAQALLDSMYARGINAFDCARGYGMAEKSLGEWVKARNNRERVIILTKCGNVSMGGKVCVNAQVIKEELEKSLKTLQMDYVDIFLLHRDDPNTSVGEIMTALNDVKRQGKVRIFGVSNWTHQRIAQANAYALEHEMDGFSISSPNFGLAEQVEDPWGGACVTISGEKNQLARAWYAQNQMPVLAYSSMGRGFFSGKFTSNDMEGAKQVLDAAGQKGYLYPVNMERLARAEELAQKYHCSVSMIAMRYIYSNDMNLFAIVSTRSAQRMVENIQASLTCLSAEDVKFLEG